MPEKTSLRCRRSRPTTGGQDLLKHATIERLSRLSAEALRAHRVRQNAERLRAGSQWQNEGLVFPSAVGTTLSGANLYSRRFRPLLRPAGLPPVRFHDLRHTCANILLQAGKHPKYVQEIFRHAPCL